MQPRRFVSLDGLRGVAAIAVCIGHVATMLGYSGVAFGLAVDLFFMISGFVIPHAYEAKLRRGLGFFRFMEIRLIRLYPLYITGVAISVLGYLVLAAGDGLWHLRAPARLLPWAILLLPQPHWEAQHSFLLDPPAWSLFLELVINIAYVVSLPKLSDRVVIVVSVLSTAGLAFSVAHFGTIDFGTGGIEMVYGLFRVTCPFAIGVLLYRLWSRGVLVRIGLPALVPGAIFLLLILLPNLPSVNLAVVVLAFPLLLIATIATRPQGGSRLHSPG